MFFSSQHPLHQISDSQHPSFILSSRRGEPFWPMWWSFLRMFECTLLCWVDGFRFLVELFQAWWKSCIIQTFLSPFHRQRAVYRFPVPYIFQFVNAVRFQFASLHTIREVDSIQEEKIAASCQFTFLLCQIWSAISRLSKLIFKPLDSLLLLAPW